MKKENELWDKLGKLATRTGRLEELVLTNLAPPLQRERVLPFFIKGEIAFPQRDMSERSVNLVQNANRVTKITHLSSKVVRRREDFSGYVDTPMSPGPFGVYTDGSIIDDFFDFEWNFELGTNERSYANGRITNSAKYLSRASLGQPGNGNSLLFSEENPLVLTTNQFFMLKARPTHFAAGAALGGEYVVQFQAVGTRSFSPD